MLMPSISCISLLFSEHLFHDLLLSTPYIVFKSETVETFIITIGHGNCSSNVIVGDIIITISDGPQSWVSYTSASSTILSDMLKTTLITALIVI